LDTPSPAPEVPPARLPLPQILVGAAIIGGLAIDLALDTDRPDALFTVIGGPIVVVAVLTIMWSARVMQEQETPFQANRPATALVTEGPFRFSRNPIYVSYVALVFGVGLVLGSWTVTLLAPLVGVALHYLNVLPEERHLQQKFGKDYEIWAAETPRWLFK